MTREEALNLFEERRSNPPKRIRNEDLYAGSPMYFYCRHCGHQSDVLPETYDPRYQQPRKVCDPCQVVIDHGWLPTVS